MKLLSRLLELAAVGSVMLMGMSVYPGILVEVLVLSVFIVATVILCSPVLVILLVIIRIVRLRRARRRKPAVLDLDPIIDKIGPEQGAIGLAADDIGPDKAANGRWPWYRQRRIIAPLAVIVGSLGLVWGQMPRRLVFAVSRPAFQRLVANAPISTSHSGYPRDLPGRWLGAFRVDRYAADPRGGVYFRTHAGQDGMGPDVMSYGFAYRPNGEGCPFGKQTCSLSHMFGDWYAFSISDD